MTVKYHAIRAELESHSVDTAHGTMAGFLVRDSASRKELGFVWNAGSSWRWKTPDSKNYGERSMQGAAVETLRQIHDLKTGGIAQPVLDSLQRLSITRPPQLMERPVAPPSPQRSVTDR